MSIWPVIVRELRAQARQPLTYWLRMAGGISVVGAIVAALWALGEMNRWGSTYRASGMQIYRGAPFAGPATNQFQSFGMTLFSKMNLFIFIAIWVFVPLASADALSRERREGTLPILYLTELHSFGIVVGKSFVHMLRAVTLFVTMAPWLMLPLVFGGVELRDICMALLLDFAAVLLAQSAGLLASTIPRDWMKSVILAELFALVLLLAMLTFHGIILSNAITSAMPPGLKPGTTAYWNSGFNAVHEFTGAGRNGWGVIAQTSSLLELTTNGSFRSPYENVWFSRWFGVETPWQQIWMTLKTPSIRAWFRGAAGMVLGAVGVLLGATWLGAWRIEKSWQEVPRVAPDSGLRQRYLTPRFRVASFKRRLSRSLTANPIGWLQQYSTSARMVKWGWCLFIIAVECIFVNWQDIYAIQIALGIFLLFGLTFSATGSFRQELETGAFELLLVTPLRERQIIVGRLRGLWRQFIPAFLVYGAGFIYLNSGWHDHSSIYAWLLLAKIMTGFCTLPLIGLYFSVLRWNFFGAWLAACAMGMGPAWLCRIFGIDWGAITALEFVVALAAGLMLERRLKNRGFARSKNKGVELAYATG